MIWNDFGVIRSNSECFGVILERFGMIWNDFGVIRTDFEVILNDLPNGEVLAGQLDGEGGVGGHEEGWGGQGR